MFLSNIVKNCLLCGSFCIQESLTRHCLVYDFFSLAIKSLFILYFSGSLKILLILSIESIFLGYQNSFWSFSCLFWKLISQNHIITGDKLRIRQPFIFGFSSRERLLLSDSYLMHERRKKVLLFFILFTSILNVLILFLFFYALLPLFISALFLREWLTVETVCNFNAHSILQGFSFIMLAFPYILTALLLIVRTDHNHKIFIRNSLQLVRSSLKSYSSGKFGLKRFFSCIALLRTFFEIKQTSFRKLFLTAPKSNYVLMQTFLWD